MCGIAGIFFSSYSSNEEASKKVSSNMIPKIAHRGSDSEGVYVANSCCMGHTRLAITGGDSGTQPIIIDNQIIVSFNGQIYNYLDLRTDLMRRGHRFSTKSDGEVIAYAYKEYGSYFVNHLKGIFAFALYDENTEELLLCRDRVGVKPLYYTNDKDFGFSFSSEIKSLVGSENSYLDMSCFEEYLHFQFSTRSKTLFSDIHKVLPSELLTVSKDGGITKQRYWSISERLVKKDFNQYYSEKYYEDKLLSTLHNAIRRQTPKVPFGVYLSGGIDSGSVVSLMSDYSDSFKMFTGRYAVSGHDETKYAEDVAAHIRREKDLVVYTISEQDVVANLKDAIYHLDEPVAGPGLIGQYMVAKHIREDYPGIKVVIGGQGGDELFGGYARYIVAYLEACIYGALYPKDKNFVMQLDSISPIMSVLQGYEPMLKEFFSKGMFSNKDSRYFDLVNRLDIDSLSDNFKSTINTQNAKNIFNTIFHNYKDLSYFVKMTYFDFKASLPALLQVDDRVNGAFSLEGRVPLLDEELIDLAFSIPPSYKFSGGYSKGLFRKAMQGMLPESVLWRRDKMGFPVPMKKWYEDKGLFYEFVNDAINSDFYKKYFKPEITTFNRSAWGRLSFALWSNIFKVLGD